MTRARDLASLGNQQALTTDGSNIGIGTTVATSTLTVFGNALHTGVITATKFYGDGSGLTNTPQGVQGLQGLQGRQGTQGVQGLQGLAGLFAGQGTQGLQGPQGPQGVQGLQGLAGVFAGQGTVGSQGLEGSQGSQGNQGTQGVSGAFAGKGDAGSQGVQGPQGVDGDIGPQGLQGVQGLSGLFVGQGVQGTQGLQGLSNQGVQGTQGTQGLQGLAGFFAGQGTQGLQGVQGLIGQGLQGTQGTQGVQGLSGPSTTINATNDTSTTTLYPVMVGATGSDQTAKAASTNNFVYNALTNNLTVNGIFSANDNRFKSVSEKTTLISGNTVNLVYNTGGGNMAICTSTSGDVTLNVTGIPTDTTFDNNSITFSVIISQTGTARSCTSVNLNGYSTVIRWSGTTLANAIVGATTAIGYDIYSFTGINTVGSASTTANYVILGNIGGQYR